MENCKLYNIHNKYNEAYVLWEQAYENYFNPQRFTANVNAVIQALRNITFTLQAEKSCIKDFDAWYKQWQDQMKKDNALIWLHNSRTKIVHEKDFEIHSYAKVRIYDYGILYLADLRVPIFMPNEAIVGFLLKEKRIHPQMIKSEVILEIERAWIVPTYQQCDILELLLCCFPFFHNLIIDAHKQAGIDINQCNYVEIERRQKRHERILWLIENIRKPMIQKMSLVDLVPVEIRATSKKFTEKDIEHTIEHYDIDKNDLKESKPMVEMDQIFSIAKTILKKDGYHKPIAFVFGMEGIPKIISFDFERRASKYLAMENLASVVKAENIIKVILISESYSFSLEQGTDFFKSMNVADVQNKQELLSFDILEKGKKPIKYFIIFERDAEGNITNFHDPEETEVIENNFIKPILNVWKEETQK